LSKTKNKIVICDANVIIDFLECDISLLADLNALFDEVCIPYMVMIEITKISEQELIDMGMYLIETPVQGSPVSGLSPQDWSCVLAVQSTSELCITNDRKLRSVLRDMDFDILWGLETLLMLKKEHIITKSKAEKCGTKICKRNKYISEAVKDEFLKKLKQ